MQEETSPPAAGIPRLGIFDYLIFLAQHVGLLLIVPLIVAVAMYAYTSSRPKVYTSTALVLLPKDSLFTPAQAAAIMQSQAVFDGVDARRPPGVASADQLQGRVATSVSKEGLVRLDVDGDSPESAQAGANAVIQAWLATTIPGDRDREELQARVDRAKADLANVQAALASTTKALGSGERVPADGALRLASLSETADKLFTIVQWSERRLGGLGNEVVKQAPTLPARPVLPRPIPVAIKTAIGAFVVLAAGLLLLCRLQELRRDPVHGRELERLVSTVLRRKPGMGGAD